mmetsp:Transcript_22528/g.55549  ORF Transcript_22528/g.55549 Transcript_22528/m.55549 type:complete len:118 (-) Transcript_22528:273-626(-)
MPSSRAALALAALLMLPLASAFGLRPPPSALVRVQGISCAWRSPLLRRPLALREPASGVAMAKRGETDKADTPRPRGKASPKEGGQSEFGVAEGILLMAFSTIVFCVLLVAKVYGGV